MSGSALRCAAAVCCLLLSPSLKPLSAQQDAQTIVSRASLAYRSLTALRADFDQLIENQMIGNAASKGVLEQAGEARLSMRSKLVSSLFFELVALIFCAIFVWQFVNLVRSSWRFGDHAPTFLETPLWLPRSLLIVGMAALCLSLLRSLAADIGRLRSLGSTDRGRNGS